MNYLNGQYRIAIHSYNKLRKYKRNLPVPLNQQRRNLPTHSRKVCTFQSKNFLYSTNFHHREVCLKINWQNLHSSPSLMNIQKRSIRDKKFKIISLVFNAVQTICFFFSENGLLQNSTEIFNRNEFAGRRRNKTIKLFIPNAQELKRKKTSTKQSYMWSRGNRNSNATASGFSILNFTAREIGVVDSFFGKYSDLTFIMLL